MVNLIRKGPRGRRNSSLPYGGQKKKKKAKRRARWPSRDTPKCVCFSPNGPNSIFQHVSVVTSYLSPVMKGLIYSLGQSLCDHAVSGRATTNTRGMLLLKYFLIQSGWWSKFNLPVTWVFNSNSSLLLKKGCNLPLTMTAGTFLLGEKCVLQIFTLLIWNTW